MKYLVFIFLTIVPPLLMAIEPTPDLDATRTDSRETSPFYFKFGEGFPTKLSGNILLGPATATGGNPPGEGETEAILGHLTQLQLASQLEKLTGLKDVLRVGVVAGQFGEERGFANQKALNTNMALLAYQYDDIELSTLEYRFAVFDDRAVFTFKPVGFSLSSVLMPNSPYRSPSDGALSRFAGASPIYKIGSLKRGLGVDFLQNNWMQLQVAYGERDADHRALGIQYLFKLGEEKKIITGITYVKAFSVDAHLDTFTGSYNADTSGNFPKLEQNDMNTGNDNANVLGNFLAPTRPTSIHALNGTVRWLLTHHIELGGWVGLILADARDSEEEALSSTFLVSLGISDLLRKNDSLVFMVGQPPRLIQGHGVEEDEGFGMHYEAFYRLEINNYLSVSPGLFFVTEPGHISENNSFLVTALRMTLSF